jgi:hypothetical protein
MKYSKTFVSFVFSFFLIAGFIPYTIYAQTISTPPTQNCVDLSMNLRFGSDDITTEGLVTNLQNFLVTNGYFSSAYLGTGHFGPITLTAVKQFQSAQGLPTTGFVGPMTRASIKQMTCGTTTTNVSLYSILPTSGSAGSTVNVSGFGFTQNNTILFDGSVAVRNVPITSSIAIACTTDPACRGGIRQTLTFSVPAYLSPNCPIGSMCPMYMRQITPGAYTVTVQNENGTSNGTTFTVTLLSASAISISGLDAPSTLTVDNLGTWTVHVVAGSGVSNLHYSVHWGDEAVGMSQSNIMMPIPSSTQTSATLTHTYQQTGTYTPIFTVTDDNGNSTSVSNTLTVTTVY